MLAASLLTPAQTLITLLLYAVALLWALARVSWIELLADSRRQHLLYGSVFLLFVLWLVRREFDSGLTFHFIGLTVVTLLLDWPLAIVAATLAQLALVLLGQDDAGALGANGLLRILIPVLVTSLVHRLLERSEPRNLFIYIFVSGFLAAGLAAAGCLLSGLLLLNGSGALESLPPLLELAGYGLLVMFPEAFINGTLITGLVVFYPHWVATFAADRYLQAPLDQHPDDD